MKVEDISHLAGDDGPASSIDDFRELNRWRFGSSIGRGH
jgi:hypothetical protein